MLDDAAICSLLQHEFQTDRAFDDVTANLLGSAGLTPCRGWVFAKEAGVFCGERVVSALAGWLGSRVTLRTVVRDGKAIVVGEHLVELEGRAADLLAIERTLLNFLSHLCGVSSLTRSYVKAVEPFPTRILATRKTLPGLRDLQLYAVQCGGGLVHRRSLSDGILIKENHQSFVDAVELIKQARRSKSPLHRVEVEIQSLELLRAIAADLPDIVMLDNMDLPILSEAMQSLRGKCEVEVSGGISLEQVRAIAELGVHYISVGKLTHSVRALDLSLDFFRE
jgi:nicotinate-nucleotide pyrophosphorylase (carboxylating)